MLILAGIAVQPLNNSLGITYSPVVLSEVGGGGENSRLFPSKWVSLSAGVQVGLGCFESREKAQCIESERILAVGWYLLWAWAFLHNSPFHKDLIYVILWPLIANHALHLESARNELNFFMPPWRSSFFRWKLWRSVESDRYSYHGLIFKIITGAGGRSLATVACSSALCFTWDGDVAEEMLSEWRCSKPTPAWLPSRASS